MKIFTIGGSGLVGSKIVEVLKDVHTFTDLSLTNGVDITNPDSLDVIRNDTEHEVVLHLAAKADVEGCETDKALGEEGAAYRINVQGTQNVVDACKSANKKLLYISTDFVFDGTKEFPQTYDENDTPNPLNWYAMTKYKGEEAIQKSGIPSAILRIAYPFRQDVFAAKKDFVHSIMGRLSSNQPLAAVTDHIITPTCIEDIALAIDAIVQQNATGVYHVTGSQSITPYDAFMLIADTFGYDKQLITKTTRAEFFKGKAPRPFNLSINNAKIKQLGVAMQSFEEGLRKVSKESTI